MNRPTAAAPRRIKVWDLPVRLSHWVMAGLVIALLVTGFKGNLGPHVQLGQILLVVLAFRIIWGFLGSTTARFSDFIRGPAALMAYLRTGLSPTPGHSPLGALSVVAMLVILCWQVGTGLFAQDEIGIDQGPFAGKVAGALSSRISGWHATSKWLVLALIVLHVLAIFYYAIARRLDLVGPMVTGSRKVAPNMPWRDTSGYNLVLATAILALIAGGWFAILKLAL